jgi:Fic family protein
VDEVARAATETVQNILSLRERDRATLADLGGRSGNALKLHDYLFSIPVVNSKTVQKLLTVSQPTADSLIAELEKVGLLREWTRRRRNKSWIYSDYVSLFAALG